MDVRANNKKLLKEFLDLENQLQDPSIIQDRNRLRDISTKHAGVLPYAEQLKKLIGIYKQEEEILILKNSEKDPDLIKLYTEELSSLNISISALEKEIKTLQKTNDPDDKRNAIIEIRAGTGGEEAALFASDLYRMYARFAENSGWQVSILNAHYSGNGGFKEIIIGINGNGAYGKLKYESGVHRVQRVPITESAGRIHTSAASIVVLPEVDDLPDINIPAGDIKIDVYRSTGPGGQSVNTTDSAVRITHLPTGIVVTCQDNKSQHKNKDRALSILKSKLYQIQQEEELKKTDSIRKTAIRSGDRSAKIRTYNFPQNRVTDHRIKKSWHNISVIMNGGIEEILNDVREGISDENEI